MYGVVMMMALTTGGEFTAFGGRGCHGCSGYSCTGYSCAGQSCSGGYACTGYSCSGSSCHGCRGGHGLFRRGNSCHGCSGSYGCSGSAACYGCYGSAACYGCQGGTVVPKPEMKKEAVGEPKKVGQATSAPATIVVNLPAEAKLLIDDKATASTSSVRIFTSPALPMGGDYVYTLKAEMLRNGEQVTSTRQVNVRAGQETVVTMEFPAASSVASR